MIIQKELNKIYNFPGIEFYKYYCEVSNIIKNTSGHTYNQLIESITKYNSNEMINNQQKFNKFLLNC